MYQPKLTSRQVDRRRGVILMVVLALLTMFAIVGISFVFYANAAGQNAQAARDAESSGRQIDINPNTLLNYFLGQLIYDVDDYDGVYSALRGHSFGRSEFGLNYNWQSNGTGAPPTITYHNPATGLPLNSVPFNGLGRLHTTALGKMNPFAGVDDYLLPNYTYYPNDGFLRDPERLNANPQALVPWRTSPDQTPGRFSGGFNVPYTYPDLNNMFLAAVKADGTILVPSFHREYTGFNDALVNGVPTHFTGLDPANPNWYLPETGLPQTDPTRSLKYRILRPRPIDQLKANESWPPNRPYFPAPEDSGGDVKNLVGMPGGNDSFWIDLGFPVITTPDGRKYKPLFAPLIIDLDNRINLNVHGNTNNNGNHASRDGWGPWEVNVGKFLQAYDQNNNLEWKQLFNGRSGAGNPYVYGRYGKPSGGSQKLPSPPGVSLLGQSTQPRFSTLFDFSGKTIGALSLPGANPAPPAYFGFPTYAGAPAVGTTYLQLDLTARTGHPALQNFFSPQYKQSGQTIDDRNLAASNMDMLLRYGDTGTQTLTGDVRRLLYSNLFDPTNTNAARDRWLVTTHSFDQDRPGVTPYLWSAAGQLGAGYTLPAGQAFPTAAFLTLPGILSPVPQPFTGEFGSDYRAALAALGRVDLGRYLTPYPTPDANGQFNLASAQQALSDRQQFALDIFQRLTAATMGIVIDPNNPNSVPQGLTVGSPAFDALRWQAQLSVNIVDYIDEDDYMTPFEWYPAQGGTRYIVFGTELPRVVLNEAYVEYDNDPTELNLGNAGKATKPLQYNIWLELLNTFQADPSRLATDDVSGNARLTVGTPLGTPGGTAAYQIKIGLTDSGIRTNNDNPKGDPNAVLLKTTVSSFSTQVIQPVGSLYSVQAPPAVPGQNQGFVVLGPPSAEFLSSQTATTTQPTERSASLNYSQTNPGGPVTASPLEKHSIYLQRLACPALPFDAVTNPYITVDYMDNILPSDNVNWDKLGKRTPDALSQNSYGKTQPYAAQLIRPQVTLHPGEPKHTFFSHNGGGDSSTPNKDGTLTLPFDWLMHYDRQIVSAIDLLNVSMYRPFELTQQFIVGPVPPVGNTIPPTQKFQHRAYRAFTDPASRLVRTLEYMTTRTRAAGTSAGARSPGKININTVWDSEVFLALCDAQQASNKFSDQDVMQIFGDLLTSRSPSPNNVPGLNDRPFRGQAVPIANIGDSQYANGIGVDDTLLRVSPTRPTQRLFEPPSAALAPISHPILQTELLTKIFNQVTTRSNVFAVWMTVGYFEVIDDTTQPVKLGAEIGKSEGKNVRHRFFSVVDRSNIGLTRPVKDLNQPYGSGTYLPSGGALSALPAVFTKTLSAIAVTNNQATPYQITTNAPVAGQNPPQVTFEALSGTYEDIPWSIKLATTQVQQPDQSTDDDATWLLVGTGGDQELVKYQLISTPNGQVPGAYFKNSHPEGTPVQVIPRQQTGAKQFADTLGILGHPGVQSTFDASTAPWVVKYATIIQ